MNAKRPSDRADGVPRFDTARIEQADSPRITLDRVTQVSADRSGGSQASLILIAALLGIGALFLASSLLVPIVIAVLGYLTLRPTVTRLRGFGLPRSVASGVLILALFATLTVIASMLYSPAQQWIATAPESISKMKSNFASLVEPLTVLDRVEEKLTDASKAAGKEPIVEVSVKKPRVINQMTLINTTGQLVAFIAAIAVLTFFMLSTGDDLLNRALMVLPDESRRQETMQKIAGIQRSVGQYLSQITCINVGLGLAVTLVMWAAGMPTPILWGVLAGLFNFIPYVGPLAATAMVFVAASGTFDTLSRAAMTALAFWAVTAIEGQFVTPTILGRTLKVGPVVVLISVAFWGFVWGLPGVFLAVPLLIVVREIFASFKRTYPIAVIFGEDSCQPGAEREPIKDDQPIAELA